MTGPRTDEGQPMIGEKHPDKLTAYVSVLGNLVRLMTNPQLTAETGEQSVWAFIAQAASFGQELLMNGQAGNEEMLVLNSQVQKLVDEGRGPSDEEWAEWKARRMDVEARFDKARGELGDGNQPQQPPPA